MEEGIAYLQHWVNLGRELGYNWLKESCQSLAWENMQQYFLAHQAAGPARWMQHISIEAQGSNQKFEESIGQLTQWLNWFREKEQLCASCSKKVLEAWGKPPGKSPKADDQALYFAPQRALSLADSKKQNWYFSPEKGCFAKKSQGKSRKRSEKSVGFQEATIPYSTWLQAEQHLSIFPSWNAAQAFFQTPTCCAMGNWQMIFFVTELQPGTDETGWFIDQEGKAFRVPMSLATWAKWLWYTQGQPCTVAFEKTGQAVQALGGWHREQWHAL